MLQRPLIMLPALAQLRLRQLTKPHQNDMRDPAPLFTFLATRPPGPCPLFTIQSSNERDTGAVPAVQRNRSCNTKHNHCMM